LLNTRTLSLSYYIAFDRPALVVDARTTGSFAMYHVFFEARFGGAQSHWKVARDCLTFLQIMMELRRWLIFIVSYA
jgi:hypothetical protein